MRVLIVDDNEAKKPGLAPGASRVKMLEEEIENRKEVEETFRIEKGRLESVIKDKNEFLASMSHELKTPLISIIGFTQILTGKNSGELTDKQKHFIENIRTSGEFLLSLINDILDLSKIEAGKVDLNIEEISLKSTIEETLTLFYEKSLKRKIIIKKEFEPGLDFVKADKQRVKQVLINLLSNGLKFSKEDGGIITITVKKTDDFVQISVSDTGIGIKPENMGKLFGKFEQLDKGISQKYGGTGLGLAITKQLVELHGGRIWSNSEFGKGSIFIFTIPLK
jgi:signal transduction histidine kinase